jgi:hypothetical protein
MPNVKTKYFNNTMAGAPVLSGTAGALIAVLDACLVNGFNLLTLDSLVVASDVATGTKAGHAFVVNQVVLVAGASPAGLNGEWRVTSVTSNTVQFATTGISDQTATGTITIKAAPSGFEKQFSGTNLAVYRSGNVLASRIPIKVDDTATLSASVQLAEGYTDISTPVNAIVTQYFKKSNATSAAARPWVLVADDKTAYLFVSWNDTTIYDAYHFGDFSSYVVGDIYNFRLQGLVSASVPASIGQYGGAVCDAAMHQSGNLSAGYVPRAYSQLVGAKDVYQVSMAGALMNGVSSAVVQQFAVSGNHGYQGTSNNDPYPNPSPIDNGVHFSPVYIVETVSGGKAIRGEARGLLHTLESVAIAGYTIYSGVENTPSGIVVLVRSASTFTPNTIYPASVVGLALGDWA